jgi:transposase
MALLLLRENERLVAKVLDLQKRLLMAQGKDAEQLRLQIVALEKELEQNRQRIVQHASEKRERQTPPEPSAKPPSKGHGPREQKELDVEPVLWDLDDADKQCPACGDALDEWQGQFETSEEIDVIERRFVLKRHLRKKYRCRCGGCVETAPGPRRAFAGGRYSAAFAIAVATGKYLDHLPLERQVRQMARQGLVVTSQTLFDQCWALHTLLRPAYERLGELQRARPLLYVDETPWPLYTTKGQAAAASKWHIWTLVSELGVYDEIHGGRDVKAGRSLLGGFGGYVMCDGYAVYESLAKQYPAIRLVQCWTHVRRKFVECESAFPVECNPILDLIGELYAIERKAGDDLHERLRRRQTESRQVLTKIQQWAVDVRCVPGSALSDAIRYMADRWSRLTRFVDDPTLPLDNNAAERALRGPVVGRKNHYGSRSERGTEVAALFYSLLESAKLVGINPEAYLHRAVQAALDGEPIPLPHELRDRT